MWALAALGPVLLAAAVVGGTAEGMPRTFDVDDIYPNLVFGGAMPLLGGLILSRLPRHPIGWLFIGCGLASAATLAVWVYAEYGLVLHPGALPGALVAAWVSSWVWGLGFAPLATFGLLLFPDGRLPGPRWRLVAWLDGLAIGLIWIPNAFAPGPLQNHPVADNPLGVPVPMSWMVAIGASGFALLLTGMGCSTAAAVVRWRRASDIERAQLSWFALAAVLLVSAVVLPTPDTLHTVLTLVAVPLLPFSVAVAVLRRRLYGVEVAVQRSLVYTTLTVLLLLVYALTVALLGAVLQHRAGPAASLTATALVAVAFAPVRDRLQRGAARLLFGDRDDPYRVLSGVGRRLDEVDPATGPDPGAVDVVLGEIVRTVATSLRLPFVQLTVADRDNEEPLTAWVGERPDAVHAVDLTFRGVRVGSLEAATRGPREPFSAAELALLGDLGRQLGVTAQAMTLSRDLQRSRERLVTTREEERRRMRRDLHDGLGPALAGIALGLDAVSRLSAARPDEASLLARQLKEEVHASLGAVRLLVEGLRPPALDQLGLVGALRQQAELLGGREAGLEVAVDADGLPALPAAVEVAAYRITSEAMTNVSRHAEARHCRVGLCIDETGALRVEVEDDGVGLSNGRRTGVGMQAMRERAVELGGSWRAVPVPTGGTRVAARIPLVTS